MISLPQWFKSRLHLESDEKKRSLEAVRGLLDAEMTGLRIAMRKATEQKGADHAAD